MTPRRWLWQGKRVEREAWRQRDTKVYASVNGKVFLLFSKSDDFVRPQINIFLLFMTLFKYLRGRRDEDPKSDSPTR